MSNTTKSKLDICNLALSLLGTRRIRNLDEGSVESRQCAFFFPIVLEEILRTAPWSHATERASLVQDVETPVYGWDYRYPLPSDFILALDVNDLDPETQNPPQYEIEKGFVLSDQEIVWLRYIYYHDNPAAWPADFSSCVAYLLASKVAFPLTGSPDYGLALMEIFEKQERPRAVRNNANEQRRKRHFNTLESDLIRTRFR